MCLKTCVSGVLVRNGKFLAGKRRSSDSADPGYIEIPGGHVETGESLHDALLREMKEELGIQVLKMERLRIGYHKTTDGERQRIYYFHVEKWKGKIRPTEAEMLYWEKNIGNLSAMADRRAIKEILH